MKRHIFVNHMAIFSKAKEYSYEWDADGNVIVYPTNGKDDLTAIIDPEKGEVLYHINFSEPLTGSYIPIDALHDLEHFVGLLMEDGDA